MIISITKYGEYYMVAAVFLFMVSIVGILDFLFYVSLVKNLMQTLLMMLFAKKLFLLYV